MVDVLHLLIVEDDDAQYETYTDAASDFNAESSGFTFSLQRQKNVDEASDALRSSKFDAAIVDLNLDSSDAEEVSGNEILERMVGSHRFPIFVVSGNLGKLNESIRERESSFLRFHDRDKPNAEIFAEIGAICGTGITKILGGRGLIEKHLNDVFWNHLSTDLKIWQDAKHSTERALLRYTVSHLSEYLDVPADEDEYYREAEYYIKPPIRRFVATGDIAKKGNSRYVVLSPACDISVRGCKESGEPIMNADRLTLARLFDVNRKSFIKKGVISESANSKDLRRALESIISGQREKFVFLPSYQGLSAAVIDMQNLYAVKCTKYLKEYDRIATIASPFLKDIQSKFSSYYGRQGHPSLDKGGLVKKHKGDLVDKKKEQA